MTGQALPGIAGKRKVNDATVLVCREVKRDGVRGSKLESDILVEAERYFLVVVIGNNCKFVLWNTPFPSNITVTT